MNPSKVIKRLGTQPHKFRIEFIVHSGENIPFEGQHVYIMIGRGSKTARSDSRLVNQGKVLWEQQTEMFVTLYKDGHHIRFQEKLGFIELRKGIGSNKDISYMHKEINFADLCNLDHMCAHQLEFSSKIEGQPTIIKIESRSNVLTGKSYSRSFSQPSSVSRTKTEESMSFQQTVSLGKVEAFPENELDIHKEGHIESFVADFETAYVSSDQEINTAISPNTVQMLQSETSFIEQNENQGHISPLDSPDAAERHKHLDLEHAEPEISHETQYSTQAANTQSKRQLSGSKSRLLNFLRVARSQRDNHNSAHDSESAPPSQLNLDAVGSTTSDGKEEMKAIDTNEQPFLLTEPENLLLEHEFPADIGEEEDYNQEIILSSGLSPRDTLVNIMKESIEKRHAHNPPLKFISEGQAEDGCHENIESEREAVCMSGESIALLLDEFLEEEDALEQVEFVPVVSKPQPITQDLGTVVLQPGECTISYLASSPSDRPDVVPEGSTHSYEHTSEHDVVVFDDDDFEEDKHSSEEHLDSISKSVDEYFPTEVPPIRPPVRVIEEPEAFNVQVAEDVSIRWYSPQDVDEIRKNYESEINGLRTTVSNLQEQLEANKTSKTSPNVEPQNDLGVLNGVKQSEHNPNTNLVEGLNEKLQKVSGERDIYLSLLLAAKVELARYKAQLDSKN